MTRRLRWRVFVTLVSRFSCPYSSRIRSLLTGLAGPAPRSS